MGSTTSARTYNQYHVPRKYAPGKRRLSIYWTWSYPWESQRDPAAMENRFSTMTEVRTVLPNYETPNIVPPNSFKGLLVRSNYSTDPRSASSRLQARPLGIQSPCSSASIRPDTSSQ